MAIALRADAVTAIETHVTAKATSAILSDPKCASCMDGSPPKAAGSHYSSKACVNYLTEALPRAAAWRRLAGTLPRNQSLIERYSADRFQIAKADMYLLPVAVYLLQPFQ